MAPKFKFSGLLLVLFLLIPLIQANDEEYCEECSSRGYCRNDGSCHCPFEYSWSKNCSQTRKELIDYDQFIVYRSWILAIYIVVEIYTIGTLIYLSPCCSGTVWTMNVQTGCYSCILIGYALRIAYYGIDPGGFNHVLPVWADRLLSFIVFPILFTSFTIILYYWALSNYRASKVTNANLEKLWLVFLSINVMIYFLELIFTLLTVFLANGEGFREAYSLELYAVFMATKMTLMSCGFIYFGYQIHTQLKAFSPLSNQGLKAIRKIKLFTLAIFLCFFSGIIFVICYIVFLRLEPSFYLIVDSTINVLLWIATILIMCLAGKPKRSKFLDHQNNYYSTETSHLLAN